MRGGDSIKKEILIPLLIAVLGVIFLAGGASAYITKSATTTVCEACGMEIEKDDPSTYSILSSDQTVHYGCCPICAQIVGIYYNNSEVNGKCFACSRAITLTIQNGNLTATSPTGSAYNVSVVFGAMCMKNKIVCSNACAESVRGTYDWAADLPLKTTVQSFGIAKTKYSQFTIGYKPITIPNLVYGLIGSGIILLALAPVSWAVMKRRYRAQPIEGKPKE